MINKCPTAACVLLAVGALVPQTRAQIVPTPTTTTVQAFAAGSVVDVHPWALTISPAPVGGTNNEVFTNTITNLTSPEGLSWDASGSVTLQAGQVYTFRLSTAFGGAWTTYPPPNIEPTLYNVTYSQGAGPFPSTNAGITPPNWYGSSWNPQDGFNVVTATTLGSAVWSFQVGPQMSPFIEDQSFNPPITSYVPIAGVAGAHTIPLATDLYLMCGRSAVITSIMSNRNSMNPGTDVFTPSGGLSQLATVPPGSPPGTTPYGFFKTTLSTTTEVPAVNCERQADYHHPGRNAGSSRLQFTTSEHGASQMPQAI